MKEKIQIFLGTLDEEETFRKRELFLGGLALGMVGMIIGLMTGVLLGKGINWSLALFSNNGCNNSDNKAAMTLNSKKKEDKHKNKHK